MIKELLITGLLTTSFLGINKIDTCPVDTSHLFMQNLEYPITYYEEVKEDMYEIEPFDLYGLGLDQYFKFDVNINFKMPNARFIVETCYEGLDGDYVQADFLLVDTPPNNKNNINNIMFIVNIDKLYKPQCVFSMNIFTKVPRDGGYDDFAFQSIECPLCIQGCSCTIGYGDYFFPYYYIYDGEKKQGKSYFDRLNNNRIFSLSMQDPYYRISPEALEIYSENASIGDANLIFKEGGALFPKAIIGPNTNKPYFQLTAYEDGYAHYRFKLKNLKEGGSYSTYLNPFNNEISRVKDKTHPLEVENIYYPFDYYKSGFLEIEMTLELLDYGHNHLNINYDFTYCYTRKYAKNEYFKVSMYGGEVIDSIQSEEVDV